MIQFERFRFILLPAILAITFPFYTLASGLNPQSVTWKMIDENEVSATYIDTSSNRNMGNSVESIRTLINFKQRFGKAMSSITVNEFNCINRSVRYVKGEGFTGSYGRGELIGTTRPEDFGKVTGQFSPVDNDNPTLSQLYDLACGQK